jgi:hypothetical protein
MRNTPILKKTVENIQKLPEDKISEVNDFIEFLLYKIDNQMINNGLKNLIEDSKTYEFLNKEPDIYSVSDVKEKYNAKR